MLDLALLRNRVLVGSTIAILIGAGTINALMYLLSLYFQDPEALGFTTLQAGLATLPATLGLVAIAAAVPRLTARFGGRQVVGIGFLVTAVGFAALGFVDAAGPMARSSCHSWPWPWEWACRTVRPRQRPPRVSRRTRSAPPPASPTWRATSAPPWRPHWPRRSTAPSSPIAPPRGPPSEALASGLATASWVMAGFSFAGVLMAVVMGRHQAARGTLHDSAAAAAATSMTLPTTATGSVPQDA